MTLEMTKNMMTDADYKTRFCAVEDALTAMRTTYRSMSEMLRMWHIGQVEIS